MRPRILPILAGLTLALHSPSLNAQDSLNDRLDALLQVLVEVDDSTIQRDILRGIDTALQGRRSVDQPELWSDIEGRLLSGADPEIRRIAESLSLKFGSEFTQNRLRQRLLDTSAPVAERRDTLNSLVQIRDEKLTEILPQLLQTTPALHADTLQAMAAFDNTETPHVIVNAFDSFNASVKRQAMNTLASRPQYAETLAAAIESGKIPSSSLTAALVRQLTALNNDKVDAMIETAWGAVRESPEEKKRLMASYRDVYRAGGSTPGDATRGRAVYARLCAQCHTLFDSGGSIGPDLTGSNRGDLDYILENMVDPNAVVPNEYQLSTVETTDFRILTGVVDNSDADSIVVKTTSGPVRVPRDEIQSVSNTQLSMMPEGLLSQLKDQELRDLIYYLRGPSQAPLKASDETVDLFFNERDLTNWTGDTSLWSVENGEIVGLTQDGLQKNEFLVSDLVVDNFRLTLEVKLLPNSENSGVQFRSELQSDGALKGYQADVGQGWWGKLYHEHGRALLWDQPGDEHVKLGEWNTYEILAVDHHIQTAINGNLCVDLKDPEGELSGVIAFQLHSGGPMEVRFRNLKLEANPENQLKTIDRE